MKKFAAIALVASLASTAAFAGGPVVVAEEAPVVAVAGPTSSAPGYVLPLVGLAAVAALASSSSGSH